MKALHERRSKRRLWLVLLGIAVLIFAVLGVLWWMNVNSGAPQKVSTTSTTSQHATQPVAISSNVLVVGNTFWGRYINDWSMASSLRYKYPFSRLHEFHREKYDAWLSGLECPTAADVHMTSAQQEEQLQFNCSPKYLPEAAKWFTAFTLANNHTDNQGVEGFAETQKHLDENGIQYFGHYDPRALKDICDVISMPVTITNDDKTNRKGNLPVAMCGYHGVFRIPGDDAIALMKEYAKYMPVLAFPHMGQEYKPLPDQIKTDVYRSLIDNGADVVLGDHPHWIQNTEAYKGHLIVYSMGNFMFDQQDTPDVIRSAGINMVMNIKNTNPSLLEKWLALGDSCKSYHDDCLEKAKSQNLTKLDVTYKFGVVGTNDGDKIVKPATKAQQESILQRLNWQNTMSQLRTPYSSL